MISAGTADGRSVLIDFQPDGSLHGYDIATGEPGAGQGPRPAGECPIRLIR